MGLNVAQKLIKSHLLSGAMTAGKEIGIRIDQTLTQDATGTLVMLELESMGLDSARTNCPASMLTTISFRKTIRIPMIISSF